MYIYFRGKRFWCYFSNWFQMFFCFTELTSNIGLEENLTLRYEEKNDWDDFFSNKELQNHEKLLEQSKEIVDSTSKTNTFYMQVSFIRLQLFWGTKKRKEIVKSVEELDDRRFSKTNTSRTLFCQYCLSFWEATTRILHQFYLTNRFLFPGRSLS